MTALPWTVNMGTLIVTGAMANSTVTVNNGGTLAGIGAVGAVTINGHGIFAPGNGTPGSSMSVPGNLAMHPARSIWCSSIPRRHHLPTLPDRDTRRSHRQCEFASGSYVSKQYTILTTGGISGTFGALANTNLPANFHDTLSYDAEERLPEPRLASLRRALNVNQQNVANTLTNFFNSPAVFRWFRHA